jgi:hypothetical protein
VRALADTCAFSAHLYLEVSETDLPLAHAGLLIECRIMGYNIFYIIGVIVVIVVILKLLGLY